MQRLSLRGASSHTVDDKFRFIIPKRLLDVLGPDADELVLTAHPDNCLLLMDRRTFEDFMGKIGGDLLEPEMRGRDLRRVILGHAEDVKPDKTKRVLISESLRAFLGLGEDSREVVAVGTGDWIEIWHPRVWADRRQQLLAASSLSAEQVVSQAS